MLINQECELAAENTKKVGTEGIPYASIWLKSSRKGVTSKNRTKGTILWL